MTKTDTQIRPIRTDEDHRSAVKRIEMLMTASPGTPEGEELDVLATLVDAYEAKHHRIAAPDPAAAIRFRMEQQQLTRKDLEPFIGSRARVSEILSGRRSLSLGMIRRIVGGLGISAEVLIMPAPALETAGPRPAAKAAASSPSARRTANS